MGLWDLITGSSPSAVIGETANKTISGVFDGIRGIISEFHLSPEQEVKVNLALETFKLEYVKAYVADVQSARQMQLTKPSLWPGIISSLVLAGYMWALWFLVHYGLPSIKDSGAEVTIMLFQTLNIAVGMVLQFWLGSSSGSQSKDWLLYKSSPNK